jgi:hypothetical protein
MEFDWNNPPFELGSLNQRLMPDSPRFGVQARFFNLGMSAGGIGILSVYRTNGRLVRVLLARPFEPEERFFYQRKMGQTLSQ